jgi:hypothetical protein
MRNPNSTPKLAQDLMRLSMDHQTRLFQVVEAIQERVKGDRVTHGLTEVALSMIRDNELEEKLSVVIEDLAQVSHI